MFHFWAVGNNPDGQGGTPVTPAGSWSVGNNDAPVFETLGGRTGLRFTNHPGGYSNIDTIEFVNNNPNSSYWTDGWTMEAWVYIDSSTQLAEYGFHYNIVEMGDVGIRNAFGLRKSDINGLYWMSAWNVREFGSTTYLSTNTWYHLCTEHYGNGSKIRAFINGTQWLDTTDINGSLVYSTTGADNSYNDKQVALGRSANDIYGFRGIIDSVRISKGVRYGSNFTPATTLTEDSNTWFLAQLNNNYTVDGFIS